MTPLQSLKCKSHLLHAFYWNSHQTSWSPPFKSHVLFHAYATVHSSIKYVWGVHEKWMKKSMRTIFTQSFGFMRLSNLLVLLKIDFASIKVPNYEQLPLIVPVEHRQFQCWEDCGSGTDMMEVVVYPVLASKTNQTLLVDIFFFCTFACYSLYVINSIMFVHAIDLKTTTTTFPSVFFLPMAWKFPLVVQFQRNRSYPRSLRSRPRSPLDVSWPTSIPSPPPTSISSQTPLLGYC